MDSPKSATAREQLVRWLVPAASLAIFAAVAWVIHRELAGAKLRDVLAHARSMSLPTVLFALACSLGSYLLLGVYELLGLSYVGKRIAAGWAFFTAFVSSAIGHNLGVATLTGGAVRYRLYGPHGLNAVDIATLTGFCSLTGGLGLAILAGGSLLLEPHQTGLLLHLRDPAARLFGAALLAVVAAYGIWSLVGGTAIEIRGWSLRAPRPAIAATQLVVGGIDLVVSAAVLWLLLPASTPVDFVAFAGIYAVAVVAGLVSHVPGGMGVFESLLLLGLPSVPSDELLASLLVWRVIYYLVPLVLATLLFGGRELGASRERLTRIEQRAAAHITPVTPQIAGALAFVAGFVLLLSGATPTLDSRLAHLLPLIPLSLLELSHLAGSVIGLGLLVIGRALFRRLRVGYRCAVWLLVAGIVVSFLKGLDFEEAGLLLLVLGVLWLGRRGFYRKSSLLEARLTPAWIASVVVALGTAAWIGFFSQRHVEYSDQLWWTFAFDADAPRMLRATLLVAVLAAVVLTLSLLAPSPPEPGTLNDEERERMRAAIAHSSNSLACVALTGDKRVLFHEQGDAFIMYQISGRSWVALGDPVGPRERHEELVWRFRELSDLHGGWCVFYQVSADRLPLYIDLGFSALKLGEEARVPLTGFTLDGPARADLRQQHRRAQRDGATFEIVLPDKLPPLLPRLRKVSEAWLEDKATAEKGFSVGFYDEAYLSQGPVAIVRTEGSISAFANLWLTGDKSELSVDLMRFGADAPRGAMDFLFAELMLWGRDQGYRSLNIGMAPLSGLERHPLAPAWHRIGNFVFRYGEHFYNFDGLRRYKTKFNPEWEPKYLVAPGGLALPRILLDVSVLIAGGVRELFAK
ncbi:MAG: bifunctional lysylphosphatidylglycerol flippase/synthetase MprF [Steroidobacteraceae bacterium]